MRKWKTISAVAAGMLALTAVVTTATAQGSCLGTRFALKVSQ